MLEVDHLTSGYTLVQTSTNYKSMVELTLRQCRSENDSSIISTKRRRRTRTHRKRIVSKEFLSERYHRCNSWHHGDKCEELNEASCNGGRAPRNTNQFLMEEKLQGCVITTNNEAFRCPPVDDDATDNFDSFNSDSSLLDNTNDCKMSQYDHRQFEIDLSLSLTDFDELYGQFAGDEFSHMDHSQNYLSSDSFVYPVDDSLPRAEATRTG